MVKQTPTPSFKPIAVVGMGALFPGSTNVNEFWRNILLGRDLTSEVPPTHWLLEDYYSPDLKAVDKIYCKRAAFIPTVDFDTVEFGVPPNNVPAIDTSQLLALMVAKQVLSDATNGNYTQQDLSRVSVILGSSTLEAIQHMSARLQRPVWERMMREYGLPAETVAALSQKITDCYTPLQENSFPGLLANVVAGRVANRFNLGGTNCITDAACAGSLAAASMAINELQCGTADMVITGGVDTLNDIVMTMCFVLVQALSLTGDCRPFSDKADGTLLGEGLGMLALKRLEDAEAQGDRIYAVIRGLGTSSDGRNKSIYAPVAAGQAKAIARTYAMAGYAPGTVELIEAHGTATKAGDVAEFAGLTTALSQDNKRQHCALGSIKSQMGHTKSAAGAAGLMKAILAVQHQVLPPTLKVEKPNPTFNITESPLYINTQLRPWIRNSQHPRRAGVSSFGFGGSNYHVTVEEYVGPGKKAQRLRTFPTELIILGAENPAALLVCIDTQLQQLDDGQSLAYIARQTQRNWQEQHKTRLGIVASDSANLRQKLQQAQQQIKAAPDNALHLLQGIYYSGANATPGKVMWLFPGQGSQYVSMGADLTMAFSACQAVWTQVADTAFTGEELALQDVVFPIPVFTEQELLAQQQRLTSTAWAQPALAVTSLVQLALLKQLRIKPHYLAGHSFGELAALFAAGVMDEATLLQLARKRGELMQAAAKTPGAMLAIMQPVEESLRTIKAEQWDVTPANYNAPQQLVISGSVAAIDAAQAFFEQAKVRCHRLPVATGFHSPLVKSSQKPFREFLQTSQLHPPKIPVSANATAARYNDDLSALRDTLAEQLIKPVRFQEQIEQAYQQGVRTFIEVGAHTILTGLVGQCLPGRDIHAIALDRKGEHGVTALWHGLGQLIAAGLNPNLEALWTDYEEPVAATPPNTKGYTVKINGTNYGRPYPPKANSSKKEAKIQQQPAIKPVPPPAPVQQVAPAQPLPTKTAEFAILKTIPNHSEEEIDMSNSHLVQIQALQQLIDSQNRFQQAMAESHMAFLNAFRQLANVPEGQIAPSAMQLPPLPAYAPPPLAPMVAPMAPVTPPPAPPVSVAPMTMAQPGFTPAPPPPAPPALQAAPMAQRQPSFTPAPPPTPMPQVAAALPAMQQPVVAAAAAAGATAGQPQDLEKLLMTVVAEKTGYPLEMLNKDMAIEADLGIDSIKRVEILSAMAQQAPHLPQVGPDVVAKLHTLGDIIKYMQQQMGANPA